MGFVVEFGANVARVHTRPMRRGSAEIMLFTGVRRERHREDEDVDAKLPKAPRERDWELERR